MEEEEEGGGVRTEDRYTEKQKSVRRTMGQTEEIRKPHKSTT